MLVFSWWNETLDDGNYINSPLFSPDAFGGNGVADTMCIVDGPFANYPSSLSATTFSDADLFMARFPGPHMAGHAAVGGEMADISSSPGDPIFFLHHAWLYVFKSLLDADACFDSSCLPLTSDRIWSTWQARDPSNRLEDISGFTTITSPFVEVTLEYEMNLFGIRPNATIQDVMDISGDRICIEDSYSSKV
ncbi:hypothetical protein DXG01_003018 [Tephrocybe rancida]|nr:hypothetical protein DXG01_003018 [Tephrocybe rancida]